MEKLIKRYKQLLCSQQFCEEDLDYGIVERHKTLLSQLSKVSNSGITIFDMYKQEHIFTSYNFTELFGYDLNAIELIGNEYFDERIHPDDFKPLMLVGVNFLQLTLEGKFEDPHHYKLINEYRIRNMYNEYVRVIEQFSILEFDKHGNIWLSLCVLDLSPDQDFFQGIKSNLLNCKTGINMSLKDLLFSPFSTETNLTAREVEVLQLVKEGLLSKEISEKLFISVHTVNTHRQKILEKLNVNNSMEAVKYASSLGLLD